MTWEENCIILLTFGINIVNLGLVKCFRMDFGVLIVARGVCHVSVMASDPWVHYVMSKVANATVDQE
jgi:hypothetical protein